MKTQRSMLMYGTVFGAYGHPHDKPFFGPEAEEFGLKVVMSDPPNPEEDDKFYLLIGKKLPIQSPRTGGYSTTPVELHEETKKQVRELARKTIERHPGFNIDADSLEFGYYYQTIESVG